MDEWAKSLRFSFQYLYEEKTLRRKVPVFFDNFSLAFNCSPQKSLAQKNVISVELGHFNKFYSLLSLFNEDFV